MKKNKTSSFWPCSIAFLALIISLEGYSSDEAGSPPIVAIAITEASNGDYDEAFNSARRVGMKATSLSIFWDDYEKEPGVYTPEVNWLQIANQYYPAADTPVSLTIGVIDTVTKRVPADLAGLSFDDPKVIRRFKRFLDYAFGQIPNLQLTSISIGNEIDGLLGSKPKRWQRYEKFYKKMVRNVHKKRPGVPVGVKIMYAGLSNYAKPYANSINQHSDVILVNYYPLDEGFRIKGPGVVPEVFETVTSLYPDQIIHFAELGYPSSSECGGSEVKQERFIRKVFKSWDKYQAQIRLISFVWLTDISGSAVAEYKRYYGVDNKCFAAYLASLGLRHSNGKTKPAYKELRKQVKKRGWN